MENKKEVDQNNLLISFVCQSRSTGRFYVCCTTAMGVGRGSLVTLANKVSSEVNVCETLTSCALFMLNNVRHFGLRSV
jgi:hypothetical protein